MSARDARFDDFTFTTGGAVVRNQLFMRFGGEGTDADIRGATLLQGPPARRHHAGGRPRGRRIAPAAKCSSRCSTTRAAACSRARSSCGPDAQKTDGKMATQALLLSEERRGRRQAGAGDLRRRRASAATARPPARSTRTCCSICKARGIPPKEAEALLIQAFVGEAVETHRARRPARGADARPCAAGSRREA